MGSTWPARPRVEHRLSPIVQAEYDAILRHAEHDRHPSHKTCLECALWPNEVKEHLHERLINALDFAMSQDVRYPEGQLEELQNLRSILTR